MQAFELNVADNRQLGHVKSNDDAAARTVFDGYAGPDFVKETQCQNGLQVAFDLRRIVRVAGASLDVIDNVVFAQTPIALDLNAFDQACLWLLRAGAVRQENGRDADNDGQNGQPDDAIRVHK